MESVLVKVVSFIAVIVVGYLLKRVGFFRAEDFRLIAGLVLKVTLPCAIISNFTRIDVDAALLCARAARARMQSGHRCRGLARIKARRFCRTGLQYH